MNADANPWGLEPLLDVRLAPRGLGPRAYRFGKHLKFAVSDVRIRIEQQRELDTPERAGR